MGKFSNSFYLIDFGTLLVDLVFQTKKEIKEFHILYEDDLKKGVSYSSKFGPSGRDKKLSSLPLAHWSFLAS